MTDEPKQDAGDPGERERSEPTSIKPPAVWSFVVGLAFVAIVVVATINTVTGSDGGVLGSEDEAGTAVPDFAIADARGSLTGDANLSQTGCEVSQRPCPADAVRTPACEIDLPGSIVSCDLFRRPAVISFWFTRGGECEAQQDTFERVYRDFAGRGVSFLAVNVRDDRSEVRSLIRERGWTHPVGLDPDGALSNALQVGGCPTVIFVRRGGVVEEVALGDQTASSLSRGVEGLLKPPVAPDPADGGRS